MLFRSTRPPSTRRPTALGDLSIRIASVITSSLAVAPSVASLPLTCFLSLAGSRPHLLDLHPDPTVHTLRHNHPIHSTTTLSTHDPASKRNLLDQLALCSWHGRHCRHPRRARGRACDFGDCGNVRNLQLQPQDRSDPNLTSDFNDYDDPDEPLSVLSVGASCMTERHVGRHAWPADGDPAICFQSGWTFEDQTTITSSDDLHSDDAVSSSCPSVCPIPKRLEVRLARYSSGRSGPHRGWPPTASASPSPTSPAPSSVAILPLPLPGHLLSICLRLYPCA